MQMDNAARLWMIKTAHANLWRIPDFEIEDMIQEGFAVFYRIADTYPNITDMRHTMSLFKTAYINHIHCLAKTASRQRDMAATLAQQIETTASVELDSFDFVALVDNMPKEVGAVLRLLATEKGRAALRKPYAVKNGKRETLNERLCSLLNINPKTFLGSTARKRGTWFWDHDDGETVDIAAMVKHHFS